MDFCNEFDFEPVPCTNRTIELYIAFLVDVKKFAFSTIRSYINIISVMHKSRDLPDPITTSWNIKHLLTGVKRELGTSQNCKSPITPQLLLQIKASLDLTCHNNLVFWAACMIGFFGFLRPNNFLIKGAFNPELNLRRMDVSLHKWGMLVELKVTKTMQFRSKPIIILLPRLRGHPLCPFDALSSVLALPGEPHDPLFRLSDNSCLFYATFIKSLKHVLQFIGCDPSSYAGHSFRRGAATWASNSGLSDAEIKMLGYWSSDCFQRYVDSDRDQRLKIITLFSSLLPHS